jgi:hypothetical protein
MLWLQIATVLRDTITKVALESNVTPDTDNFSALWANQKRPFGDSVVQAEIQLSLNQGKLVDWGYTDTFNQGTNKIDRSMKGQREFVLSAQCRSFDLTEPNWAFEYAERIRTRLDREDISETLLAANVVFLEDLGIVAASAVIDGRECSVANIDLRMRCAFDDSTFPLDWIETVQIVGTVSDGSTNLPAIQVAIS